MKKTILTYICCSVFLTSFFLQNVQAKEKIDYSQAVVYTTNEYGELVESDKPVEYLSSYMYKSWSDYYGCYLLHYSLFEYSDSQRKNLISVYHDYVFSTSAETKYIGIK